MTGKDRAFLGLRGNALVLTLTEFLWTCGFFLINPFWSLYVLELGASIPELGFFSLVTGLLPAAFVAPLGYLGDRMNRKTLILVGNLLAGVGPLLNVFATDWVQLLPGTFLGSLTRAFDPVTQAVVAADIWPAERGRAYATRFTLLMVPATFTPTVAGLFIESMGFGAGMRYMLAVNGGLRLLMIPLIARFLRGNPGTTATAPRGRFVATVRPAVAAMFQPLVGTSMLRVMVTGSVASAFAMGVMTRFESVYAVEVVGLSKTEWGFITSWVALVRILTRIPLGGLADRWGRRRNILINYGLQPFCALAFPFSRDVLTVFLVLAARTLAFNVGMPAWQALIADIAPAPVRGTVYGAMGTLQIVVEAIAPIVGGVSWDALGPATIFYLSAGGRAAAAGWLFKRLREPEHRAD